MANSYIRKIRGNFILKSLKRTLLRILNSEHLIFLIFILYYIGRTGGNTTIVTQWPVSDHGFMLLRLLGAVFFGVEMIKLLIGYLKDQHTKTQWMLLVLFVLLLLSLCANFVVQGAYTFITDVMMAFVMSHIALKKTVSVRMYVLFATCLVIPVLCSMGILENLENVREADEPVRYALGFDYTTRISGIYGFATLYYCYLNKFKLSGRDIFMMIFSSLLINFLTDTRTYFYLEVFFGVIALGYKVHLEHVMKKIYYVLEKLFIHFFPIASIATLLFTLLYEKGGIFFKLDAILSHRLSQVYADLVNYGLHPFGVKFAQYGNGGAHVAITKIFGSNYVDSGFLQLLIVRGIIPFVLIVVMTYIALWQLYKHSMHAELFVLMIITLLSTFSGGLMSNESVLFIFMFYGLRLLYQSKRKENAYEKE